MYLNKFLHTHSGKYIMSVILGLGLATLFRKGCTGKNCIEFKAPTLENIKKKIYKYGTDCFKYETETTVCDDSKKSINFA